MREIGVFLLLASLIAIIGFIDVCNSKQLDTCQNQCLPYYSDMNSDYDQCVQWCLESY